MEGLADPGAPGRLQSVSGGISSGFRAALENWTDDRTRVTASTADAYDGRYSAQVNLASATPVLVNLPVRKAVLPPPNRKQRYSLELQVRSSPAGIAVHLESELFSVVGGVSAAAIRAGADWTPLKATLEWNNNTSEATPHTCRVPPYTTKGCTGLAVAMSSHMSSGGTVWLDGMLLEEM